MADVADGYFYKFFKEKLKTKFFLYFIGPRMMNLNILML